jgi:hypothetical protein
VDASTRAAEGTDHGEDELDTTCHGSTAGRWMGAASGRERGEGEKEERRWGEARRRGDARRPAGKEWGKAAAHARTGKRAREIGIWGFISRARVDGPRAFLFTKISRPAQYSRPLLAMDAGS